MQTSEEDFIFSHASLCSTLAEFLENRSVVRAYMSATERPAPRRMTIKFEVRAVVRMTDFELKKGRDSETRTFERTFTTSAQLRPFFYSFSTVQM
jgi:hypothetical protein